MSELPELRKLGYKKAMKKKHIRWTILPRLALFISREMKQHMNEVEPYSGIVNALHKMQEQGVSIGVLTSNNAVLVQEFFDAHHFPKFDFVISEKTLWGKEKALRRIMKRHKLDKSRVAYVGDEPRDINASKKAKIISIGVTWGAGGVESIDLAPPDYVVNNADELLQTAVDIANN
jgi:phosphoglycolate phosphatase